MRYRKKPVEIDAIQWTPSDVCQIVVDEFFAESETSEAIHWRSGDVIYIRTLEGLMLAAPGDWIIKGIKGEFYPCKPDIFEATYEPVWLT